MSETPDCRAGGLSRGQPDRVPQLRRYPSRHVRETLHLPGAYVVHDRFEAAYPRLHYRLLTLCPAPTDPVPRGLLTLWARAGMCVCIYVFFHSPPLHPIRRTQSIVRARAHTHTHTHCRRCSTHTARWRATRCRATVCANLSNISTKLTPCLSGLENVFCRMCSVYVLVCVRLWP